MRPNPDAPVIKDGSSPLFRLIPEAQFAEDVQRTCTKIPHNDGRWEMVAENGSLIAAAIRSPQEEMDLGFKEANRYRGKDVSQAELELLAKGYDPAAFMALARTAYRKGDPGQADCYVKRAAAIMGLPAPLTIAAMSYQSDDTNWKWKTMAATWFLAAYKSGDYTVAYKLKIAFDSLPIEYQLEAIDRALIILKEIT